MLLARGCFMKTTILDMQTLAKRRGGQCLSPTYINSHTKLTWQCKNGHQWEVAPTTIKQGRWCPACAGLRRGTIEEMQEIARERGGQCISNKYVNNHVKLTWQCKDKHRWEATPGTIKQGTWCPACAGTQKSTIEEMRELAREHGGKCLSTEYINSQAKLTWQCMTGHQWEAVPGHIKQGCWCPACAGTRKSTIEEMREIAREHGGKCLSTEYINSHAKLTWQCKDNHQWESAPANIKKGNWCPACSGRRKGTIEEMQEIARERGGLCLSKAYLDTYTSLTWQCHSGHQWKATQALLCRGAGALPVLV